jgi:hypothetical protein
MPARRRLLLGIALLAAPWWGQTMASVESPAAAATVGEMSRDEWVAYAARLVEAADSGHAPASSFRREVSNMRDNLRALVRNVPDSEREPLNDLVMMVALLDAAAACHRGGFIICPPDLMRQMRAQMARLQPMA